MTSEQESFCGTFRCDMPSSPRDPGQGHLEHHHPLWYGVLCVLPDAGL